MGKLLEQAIAEAHQLPEDEQEEIGAWLLAEIESARKWDELFSRLPSAGSRVRRVGFFEAIRDIRV